MKRLTELEILVRGRSKIESPENWTKGTLARDGTGAHVDCLRRSAVSFCMIGALYAVSGSLKKNLPSHHRARNVLKGVVQSVYGNITISQFNDRPGTSHKAVLRMFDKAIELARRSA